MIERTEPETMLLHRNGGSDKTPGLGTCALAALAAHVHALLAAEPAVPEHQALLGYLHAAGGPAGWRRALAAACQTPAPGDHRLIELAEWLGLAPGELLAVALAAAVEEDPMAGRLLAYLQQPAGGTRPTLGLVATALAAEFPGALPPVYALLTGAAVRSGLLALTGEGQPLPERSLLLPPALGLALRGMDGHLPGMQTAAPTQPLALPPALLDEATRRAVALGQEGAPLLVLRTTAPEEGGAVAQVMAAALGLRPLLLAMEAPAAGLGVYLRLRGMLPIFYGELAPGEQQQLPAIPFYSGPALAVCGPEGALTLDGRPASSWRLPVPERPARELLWQQVVDEAPLAAELARAHRHRGARIAQLGQLARYQARLQGRASPTAADVYAAAWAADLAGLETLAQPLPDPIPDEALVAPPALQRELALLLLRCRSRDGLVESLGASAQARYHPGVRALFVGASGTGKTLAAGWLATQLQMPLYRVDLAAVTSKYIGETEKNLAQLLSRAEESEVILLFDEADSLFGKRTEVQQANDRYANAQTNYLLQRIESYDGVAILTSNSRSRFDQAFTRRLDAIVEFPTPGPQERRSLWLAHLGTAHRLDGQAINRLAAVADLAGGHIRNAVITAAVLAQAAGRPIAYDDVRAGLADEYRKLGRQLPVEL